MSEKSIEAGALGFTALYLVLLVAAGLAWHYPGVVRLAMGSCALTATCYVAQVCEARSVAMFACVASWALGLIAGIRILF